MERTAETTERWYAALSSLWRELGGPGEPYVVWSGPDGLLPSPFGVQDLAMGAAATAACAARELARARGAPADPPEEVDARHVAAAFRGDQLLRLNGERFPSFAPLSGFWATADGWVRTHANYPHHRKRLLAALGLPDSHGPNSEQERNQLAAILRRGRAVDVETAVTAAGGIAVAVRSERKWDGHPQGRVVAAAPLMQRAVHDGSLGANPAPIASAADGLPARGFRVLDLTRVIAGPVATRTLALLGADVLRIDPPGMPELDAQHLDTDLGKRSAVLDLHTRDGRAALVDLLARAHVVVTSYRPGALDVFGLNPGGLAMRRPDLVVATLSAWGDSGPFAGRRGFDSVVQAASGIALRSARDDGSPGALPVQALDHATGYLTAAAVLLGLAVRVRQGPGTTLRSALASTAHWLRMLPPPDDAAVDDPVAELEPALIEVDCPAGRLRHPLPAFRTAHGPTTWELVPGRWGADAPAWADD